MLHLQTTSWADIYVAVLGRNQTLFCSAFWSQFCIWRTLVQSFCKGWGLIHICRYTKCEVHMRSTLNRSFAQKHSNVFEIRNKIMFHFHPGLPHIELCRMQGWSSSYEITFYEISGQLNIAIVYTWMHNQFSLTQVHIKENKFPNG